MTHFSAWFTTMALAASAAMGVQQAVAADFLKFPVESAPELISKPVELGSGWYLRGDLAWSKDKGPQLVDIVPEAQKNRWAIDLGAGYKFNNWLRTDATISSNKPRDTVGNAFTVICPYVLTQNVLDKGFLWSPAETCSPQNKAELRKIDLMLNAYIDIGSWNGLTPYVGVGAGVSMLKSRNSVTYYKTGDGTIYGADLTPTTTFNPFWDNPDGSRVTSWVDATGVTHSGQPPVAFTKQNWNREGGKTAFNLAWALMGGVSYDVTPQLKAELSYRYLNSGSFTGLAITDTTSAKSTIESHQVRVGFRYMID